MDSRLPQKLKNGFIKVYRDDPLTDEDFQPIPQLYVMRFMYDGITYECKCPTIDKLNTLRLKLLNKGVQVVTFLICKEDYHLPQYIKAESILDL